MKKLLTLVVVGLLVGWFACRVLPARLARTRQRERPAPAKAAQPTAPQLVWSDTLSFSWQDVNTRKVVDREGDTFTIDPSVKPTVLHLEVPIDRWRLAAVIDSFGYPDAMLGFEYRSEAERRAKRAELEQQLGSRGFELVGEDRIRVDYSWVVASSRQDMRPVAEGLATATRKAGYTSSRELSGGVTSFVQSLEYRQPPEVRTNGRGEKVNTGGVTMPLETLATRAGDCDTKSLLLASILENVRGAGVLLLEGSDHVFVGLRMAPQQQDHFVRVQGIEYVLVEVTTPWPIGSIPADVMAGLARNEFRVVRLD